MKIKATVEDLNNLVGLAAITRDPKALGLPNSKIYVNAVKKENAERIYLYSNNSIVRSLVKLNGSVEEPGEILLDPEKLLGGLQGRDPKAEVSIETVEDEKSGKVTVKVGRNKFHLPLYMDVKEASKEVGHLPLKAPSVAELESVDLVGFIRKTIFCIASASSTQSFIMDAMQLVIGEKNTFATAMDGFSVAWVEMSHEPTNPQSKILIPYLGLNTVQKLLASQETKVELVYGDIVNEGPREVFFRTDRGMFGVRLLNGNFPDTAKMINYHRPDFNLVVAKDDLKFALKRATNFVEEKSDNRRIKFSVKENALRLEAKDGVASDIDDIIDATPEGPVTPMSISFSIDYMLNILTGFDSEYIKVGFNTDPRKAITITDSKEDRVQAKYVLMPCVD